MDMTKYQVYSLSLAEQRAETCDPALRDASLKAAKPGEPHGDQRQRKKNNQQTLHHISDHGSKEPAQNGINPDDASVDKIKHIYIHIRFVGLEIAAIHPFLQKGEFVFSSAVSACRPVCLPVRGIADSRRLKRDPQSCKRFPA
jgi:hypothetical protein